MKTVSIHLKASSAQRELIDHAAGLTGQSGSTFIVDAACEKAGDMLLDRVYFELDEKRFAAFVAMLDAPATDNPALTRLLARRAPWER